MLFLKILFFEMIYLFGKTLDFLFNFFTQIIAKKMMIPARKVMKCIKSIRLKFTKTSQIK